MDGDQALLGPMQPGQLILMEISKTVAIRCQFLRPKFSKFDFSWTSIQYPTGRAFSPASDPIAVFKGPTFRRIGLDCAVFYVPTNTV